MKKRPKILVVDDEDIVRESLRDWLDGVGYKVDIAESAEKALRIIKQKKTKIMIADLIMPGINGIELMKKAREIVPTISTVIITAHGTIQTAIAAIREGAYDYVEKPFCPEKVELLIKNLVEHQDLVEENISLRRKIEDRFHFEGIIAKSPKMLKIIELIKTVAPANATILIIGKLVQARKFLPGLFIIKVRVGTGLSLPQVAQPFQRACWRVNFSVMKKVLLQEQWKEKKASSRREIKALYSLMK